MKMRKSDGSQEKAASLVRSVYFEACQGVSLDALEECVRLFREYFADDPTFDTERFEASCSDFDLAEAEAWARECAEEARHGCPPPYGPRFPGRAP